MRMGGRLCCGRTIARAAREAVFDGNEAKALAVGGYKSRDLANLPLFRDAEWEIGARLRGSRPSALRGRLLNRYGRGRTVDPERASDGRALLTLPPAPSRVTHLPHDAPEAPTPTPEQQRLAA